MVHVGTLLSLLLLSVITWTLLGIWPAVDANYSAACCLLMVVVADHPLVQQFVKAHRFIEFYRNLMQATVRQTTSARLWMMRLGLCHQA